MRVKNKLIIFLIIGSFVFLNTEKANAGGWWFESIAAEVMHETWAQMEQQVRGMALSRLKQQGMKDLIGRLSDEAKSHLIDDYNKHLSGGVNSELKTFTSDYFSVIRSRESLNSGNKKDAYMAETISMTEKAIQNDFFGSTEPKESDIARSFSPDADIRENLFNSENEGGGVDTFLVAMETENHAYGRMLEESTKVAATKEKITEARKTEAAGNDGYTGDAAYSGSVYKEMAAVEKTYEQDLIANAENPIELAQLVGGEYNPGDLIKDALKAGKDQLNQMSRQAWRKTYQGVADFVVGRATGGLMDRKGKVRFNSSSATGGATDFDDN